MKRTITALTILAASAGAALAEGDAEAGKKIFNQCQTCHVVAAPDGTILAGKNAKTGPNLYGVVGRQAGTYPDFKYGESMVEAGTKGLVWDQVKMVEYVANPTKFLKTTLDNPKAKGNMAFNLKKPKDAENVVAFIASLTPAADAAAAPAEGETAVEVEAAPAATE